MSDQSIVTALRQCADDLRADFRAGIITDDGLRRYQITAIKLVSTVYRAGALQFILKDLASGWPHLRRTVAVVDPDELAQIRNDEVAWGSAWVTLLVVLPLAAPGDYVAAVQGDPIAQLGNCMYNVAAMRWLADHAAHDKSITAVDDGAPFYPAAAFASKYGEALKERLKKAKQRLQIRFKIVGGKTHYSHPDAHLIWPDDVPADDQIA